MKKKILVIDDNRVMLTFMTNLLKKEGHEVVTAENSISALDIVCSFTPDIIFIDFVLPIIGGDKLCLIFRSMQNLKDCRIVILSGALAELEIDHATIGADTFIAKGPFDLMTQHILATIRGDDSPRMGSDSKKILGLENVRPRQMTKELFLRIRHLESVLESIAEGVIEISSGRIVYANPAVFAIFGTTLEKILNSNPLNLFDNKTHGSIIDMLESTTDVPMEIGTHKPLTVGDRLVTIKIVPIQKSQSNKIMLISDVTNRRQMELELQHARKMETIGTIASGIAHNFRNTLAGILANSQVIQLSYPNDEKLLGLINRINSSVLRGTQLVDRLLEFSYKQTKNEFQLIDLVLLIQETILLTKESFDKRIKIHINVTGSLPILGDQSGLSSVLMNLYNNARDAMPEGGTLSLEARQQGNSAVVIISDTGCGMAEETIEKCFDPFFTTKEIGKGTGLGLSTAYGIVKSHNGIIHVKSRPNEGSEFELLFPLAMTPEKKLEISPIEKIQISEAVRSIGKKILVVDDEMIFVKPLIQLLESLDYRADSADNCSQAIDKYKTWQPDIVLMDINMPEIDGITCAKRIIEYDPNATIIIVSGYDEYGSHGIKQTGKKIYKGYLTKPVGLDELKLSLSRFHSDSDNHHLT